MTIRAIQAILAQQMESDGLDQDEAPQALRVLQREAQRDGSAIEARHVAEVLAGMTGEPAIGAPARAHAGPTP